MRGRQVRCKAFSAVKIMTVTAKEVPTKSVPAVAVIQMVRALFILIGRKGYVGGDKNFVLKAGVETAG